VEFEQFFWKQKGTKSLSDCVQWNQESPLSNGSIISTMMTIKFYPLAPLQSVEAKKKKAKASDSCRG
jgi:hypothetical protein